MDYSSERRDYSSSQANSNYYGPSSSSGGRGGGGGFSAGRGYGGGRRGRGGYHPYRDGSRGRGGPRRPSHGNRFQADREPQDPHYAALQSMLQMMRKVGDLQPTETVSSKPVIAEEDDTPRSIVTTQANNIQALANVLCGSSANVFLQFQKEPDTHMEGTSSISSLDKDSNNKATRADKQAGPLAAGIVHLAITHPLQAPCYAALTLAVHETARTQRQHDGLVQRCLHYATHVMGRDLDALLLTSHDLHFSDAPQRAHGRIQHQLRFLASLARAGMVLGEQDGEDPVPAASNQTPLSLIGILQVITQAAIQAKEKYNNRSAAVVLASLVLETIPAVVKSVTGIEEKLFEPLETSILNDYTSMFQPGVGKKAILLKDEQLDDIGESPDDDEEEDDDDDDDEPTGQVCDSFQDLVRTVQHLVKGGASTRLLVFDDAPWESIPAPGTDESEDKITFSEEPLLIDIFPVCQSLSILLGAASDDSQDSTESVLKTIELDGIVFGRLPVFGPPPEATDDEDNEEDMEESSPKNERLEAYKNEFRLVDRYLLGKAVRDLVLSHEMSTTEVGVQKGTAKDVAEQVWSLGQMIDGDVKGFEYGIIEALLSIVVQSEIVPNLRNMLITKVLIELTRLDPSTVAPAIVLALSNLFDDYMPALVPCARLNLSRWFATHLTNTDYQWPAGYWKHWEAYVLFGWKNSRGAFVKNTISTMLENVSDPSVLVRDCFPKGSALCAQLVDPINMESTPLQPLCDDLERRLWTAGEEASTVSAHLLSDEVSEQIAGLVPGGNERHPRLVMVARTLLKPIRTDVDRLLEAIAKAQASMAGGDDAMQDEIVFDDTQEDAITSIVDAFGRYHMVLRGAMAKDLANRRAGDDEKAFEGEAETLLLRLIHDHLGQFRASELVLLRALLTRGVVMSPNLLDWTLDGPQNKWWDFASMVFHHEVTSIMDSVKNTNAMDDGDDSQSSRVVERLDVLLSRIIVRACTLAGDLDSETRGNKYAPQQVELVEGLKYLIAACHSLVKSCTARGRTVDLGPLSGPRLASKLTDYSNIPVIENLVKGLE